MSPSSTCFRHPPSNLVLPSLDLATLTADLDSRSTGAFKRHVWLAIDAFSQHSSLSRRGMCCPGAMAVEEAVVVAAPEVGLAKPNFNNGKF
jgi:hypothetical protein